MGDPFCCSDCPSDGAATARRRGYQRWPERSLSNSPSLRSHGLIATGSHRDPWVTLTRRRELGGGRLLGGAPTDSPAVRISLPDEFSGDLAGRGPPGNRRGEKCRDWPVAVAVVGKTDKPGSLIASRAGQGSPRVALKKPAGVGENGVNKSRDWPVASDAPQKESTPVTTPPARVAARPGRSGRTRRTRARRARRPLGSARMVSTVGPRRVHFHECRMRSGGRRSPCIDVAVMRGSPVVASFSCQPQPFA
jgi:hypothetical protein